MYHISIYAHTFHSCLLHSSLSLLYTLYTRTHHLPSLQFHSTSPYTLLFMFTYIGLVKYCAMQPRLHLQQCLGTAVVSFLISTAVCKHCCDFILATYSNVECCWPYLQYLISSLMASYIFNSFPFTLFSYPQHIVHPYIISSSCLYNISGSYRLFNYYTFRHIKPFIVTLFTCVI